MTDHYSNISGLKMFLEKVVIGVLEVLVDLENIQSTLWIE